MQKQRRVSLYIFASVLSVLLITFLLLPPLYSCVAKEQQEWNYVKNNGSVEELFDFAEKYKDSGFTELLIQANNTIRDYIANEEDTDILNGLLSKYPARETELRNRIAEIAFNEADDLEKFIAEFEDYGADEKYINEAREKLKNLYFTAAKNSKSIELFEDFIAKYENEDAAMTEEAKNLIDDISWENVLNLNTRDSYADYVSESLNRYDGKYGKYIGEANKKIEEFDWADAYAKTTAESRETLLPLLDFIETYPDSAHVPEAETLIETMRADPSYYERYAGQKTLEAIEEFIANFPGHKDIGDAAFRLTAYTGNIDDFAQRGYIHVTANGKSIREVTVTVKNATSSELIVNIPIGVYFAANSGNVQNMAVTKAMNFRFNSLEEITLTVQVACMNISRDIPTESDTFTPQAINSSSTSGDSPLLTLLRILDKNSVSFAVAQTAIWHMQDNPGKDVLLTALVNPNGEYTVTEDDYNEAVRLVESALEEFSLMQPEQADGEAEITETTE